MGVDIFGAERGYFRRSVWGWHPLAELCQQLAPDITARCRHWHSNDGDGLDADDARRLGEVLIAALSDGRVNTLIASREAYLATLPRVRCNLCGGSGIRSDAIGTATGQPDRVIERPGHPRHGQRGWCNGCDGFGSESAFESRYRVCRDDVEAFAQFLIQCGGFQIC